MWIYGITIEAVVSMYHINRVTPTQSDLLWLLSRLQEVKLVWHYWFLGLPLFLVHTNIFLHVILLPPSGNIRVILILSKNPLRLSRELFRSNRPLEFADAVSCFKCIVYHIITYVFTSSISPWTGELIVSQNHLSLRMLSHINIEPWRISNLACGYTTTEMGIVVVLCVSSPDFTLKPWSW